MKRKFNILLLSLLFAFASCSFTSKTFEDSDKDRLLIQLITYLLEQGHFEPRQINDALSERIFTNFLDVLDPYKRYYYNSDFKEFERYKTSIDDELRDLSLDFFNLAYNRLLMRMQESKAIYTEILSKPFDFSKSEEFDADYDNLVYVRTKAQLKDRWRKQLKLSSLYNYHDQLEEGKNKPDDLTTEAGVESKAREMTLNTMNENFDNLSELNRDDFFAFYLNVIATEFDPHTYYFAPSRKDQFDAEMKGTYEGIGARLYKRSGNIVISELIPGGAAWRQDLLKVGDIILKVRQEDETEPVVVSDMRLNDAIKFIKGPKDTTVYLTVKRLDGTIEELGIPRDKIELEETYAKSTTVTKKGYKYGLINLPKFYIDFDNYNNRNAASDVKNHIISLKEEGMDGLVIDLRNNGGGSLKTVVDIAGLFIKEGPVVQVRSTGQNKEVLKDRDKSIVWDGPLVILVNEFSASASEILAAAMQDYNRAIVIGSRQTYGKGTVQNVIDLNRMIKSNTHGDMGALKFTTQKYYRINGGSTQLKGVNSDIELPSRYSYMEMGEREQSSSLDWDEIEPANYVEWSKNYNYDLVSELSRKRTASNHFINLIDANAKWIKNLDEDKSLPLNYEVYKKQLSEREKAAKVFDTLNTYNSNLSFNNLLVDMQIIQKDSVYAAKMNRWHSDLTKDVYINEAINVLLDISQLAKSKKVTGVNN